MPVKCDLAVIFHFHRKMKRNLGVEIEFQNSMHIHVHIWSTRITPQIVELKEETTWKRSTNWYEYSPVNVTFGTIHFAEIGKKKAILAAKQILLKCETENY